MRERFVASSSCFLDARNDLKALLFSAEELEQIFRACDDVMILHMSFLCHYHRFTTNLRLVFYSFLFILTLLIPLSNAGCFQQRMCCPGRNNTCRSHDDGVAHLSRSETSTKPSQIRLMKLRGEEFPKVYTNNKKHEKIGRLILPDVVALEGPGMDYAKKYGHSEYFTAVNSREKHPKNVRRKNDYRKTKAIKTMIFGLPIPEEPSAETAKFIDRLPLIRYSVLNRNLPLVIEEQKPRFSDSSSNEEYDEYEDDDTDVMYLTEADPLCYCDELCIRYGDCCSDYTYVCPPQDCQVSEWSAWTECFTERGHRCGCGKQERRRSVLQEAYYGGRECPPLVETKGCFRECPRQEAADITTVALLLDYKYHDARKIRHKNSTYTDYPEAIIKEKNYCVKYELGWVNRNCIDKRYITSLFTGSQICAECQPEAQLHRRTPRCASDLDDGMKGFWKLIGPLSCNGIWKRILRIDNCRCSEHLPDLPPYLMILRKQHKVRPVQWRREKL